MKIFSVSLKNCCNGSNDLVLITSFLVIPPMLIHYPFYHPNRSRFFNTATLFDDFVYTFHSGFSEQLKENWNLELPDNDIDYAYENYVNWEKSGGKELHLPGFFLTNVLAISCQQKVPEISSTCCN